MLMITLVEKNKQMVINSYNVPINFLIKDVYCGGNVYAKLKNIKSNNIQDSFILSYIWKINFSNILEGKSKEEISGNDISLTNISKANIPHDMSAV